MSSYDIQNGRGFGLLDKNLLLFRASGDQRRHLAFGRSSTGDKSKCEPDLPGRRCAALLQHAFANEPRGFDQLRVI